MKITTKTIMSMRSATSAMLVAGAVTGTSQGAGFGSTRTDMHASERLIQKSSFSLENSKGDESAKDPVKKEKKEEPEKKEPKGCPACGLG